MIDEENAKSVNHERETLSGSQERTANIMKRNLLPWDKIKFQLPTIRAGGRESADHPETFDLRQTKQSFSIIGIRFYFHIASMILGCYTIVFLQVSTILCQENEFMFCDYIHQHTTLNQTRLFRIQNIIN